jgi:glutamyl-Q tRNA(Asp) synthetase
MGRGEEVDAAHHVGHALLTDAQGRRLAKRDGAPSLADLRAAGEDGLAVAKRLRRS